MKLFLDTGSVEEIWQALGTGLIDGVTTNPSLLAKEGGDLGSVVGEIVELFSKAGVEGSVSAEVLSVEVNDIVAEARDIAKIDERVVVKGPSTIDGLSAVKELSAEGVRTNVTLCFSAGQALLAAKAGATYVSPFMGRLDDINEGGLELVEQMRQMYDNYGFGTEILAASVRSPRDVVDVALAGADIATVPSEIFWQLFEHPLTDAGLEKFLEDAGVGADEDGENE